MCSILEKIKMCPSFRDQYNFDEQFESPNGSPRAANLPGLQATDEADSERQNSAAQGQDKASI